MKFRHLLLITSVFISALSCEKVSTEPESYTKYFELVSDDFPGAYVNVVPTELISNKHVEKHIVGYGWESVALYEIDRNKEIITEYEIVKDDPIFGNKEHVEMFEISGFGADSFIDYHYDSNVYELSCFNYDETTGKISLRSWHVGHSGKLVYLSDDVMVCVDSKDFTHTPEIYLAVFKKVSNTTLNNWREQHPYKLTWE